MPSARKEGQASDLQDALSSPVDAIASPVLPTTKVSEADVGIFAPGHLGPRVGYLAQYLTVGIIYAGLPACAYGFFLGYLSVPGYIYSTALVITSLPWSFKFAFGILNDTVPLFGLRRKPYMVIGWAFCSVWLFVLSLQPLPTPYWCIGEDGEYIRQVTAEDGSVVAATPCNPEAAKSGGRFALLMFLAATGFVIADVAADGLTVEYARAEPLHLRGRTQTTAYLTRAIGQAIAAGVVGLGMNSKLYNGSFERGLSFSQICLIFAVPAAAMIPISVLLVREPPNVAAQMSFGAYRKLCWELLRSKAMLAVILFSFLTPAISNITTTAAGLVKSEWAGVKNLENQAFSLGGSLLFAVGLGITKRYFLHASWRIMLASTTVFLNSLDLIFVGLTVFNVVRNEYFYLGETVLYEVPAAAQFVVSTFVIVEMAEGGSEGMVYGLLTTASNLGGPAARALGNQIYGLFQPNLSDQANYIEDTPRFRVVVFASFLLSFSFAMAALAALPLLPDQKDEACVSSHAPRSPLWSDYDRAPSFHRSTGSAASSSGPSAGLMPGQQCPCLAQRSSSRRSSTPWPCSRRPCAFVSPVAPAVTDDERSFCARRTDRGRRCRGCLRTTEVGSSNWYPGCW